MDKVPRSVHDLAIDGVRTTLPEIIDTPLDTATLLGSPLTTKCLPSAVEAATALIRRLCDHLKHLDRHTALFFLVHFVSAPRLLYLLRSAPLYLVPKSLKVVDSLVRDTLVQISNVTISERSWEQAKLPIRLGGLGVRSVEDLALPCYIASLHAATPLIRSIYTDLPPPSEIPSSLRTAVSNVQKLMGANELTLENYFSGRRTDTELALENYLSGSKRALDTRSTTMLHDRLIDSENQLDLVRLAAACQPHTAT